MPINPHHRVQLPPDDSSYTDTYTIFTDHPDMVDVFLHHPVSDLFLNYPVFDSANPTQLPFRFDSIRFYQQNSDAIRALPTVSPTIYEYRTFGAANLVVNRATMKFPIPDTLVDNLVRWYHTVTFHAEGIGRLTNTIERHFENPNIKNAIRTHVANCPICQRHKHYTGRGHGELPPRQATLVPWEEVHTDTIGNWRIRVPNLNWLHFRALTSIDPVTCLLEIILIPNKTIGYYCPCIRNILA